MHFRTLGEFQRIFPAYFEIFRKLRKQSSEVAPENPLKSDFANAMAADIAMKI